MFPLDQSVCAGRSAHDPHFIAGPDDSARQYARKNALAGHDAIAYGAADGTAVIVTVFADLCDLTERRAELKRCGEG